MLMLYASSLFNLFFKSCTVDQTILESECRCQVGTIEPAIAGKQSVATGANHLRNGPPDFF